MSRPFAVIGFTVFFTIALLFKFDIGVTVAALAVFSVTLIVGLFIESLRKNSIFLCSVISVIISCILLLGTNEFIYLPAVSYSGKTCNIVAELISEPEYEYGNCYYSAKIKEIDGQVVDLKSRLVFSSVPDAEPYDIVTGDFTFYIPGETNDITLSVNKSNGVFIGAYPYENEFSFISVPESEKPFGKTIIDIRNAVRNSVYRVLPNENGALAVALLIGDKSGLSLDILDNFNFTGISHIICVSGYHLSLWSLLCYELLRKTRIGNRFASFITVIPVVLFMFISGMTYSVIRAGIMTIIYLFSNVFMRKRDSLNSLGFALMLIAVFNPFAMGSASLQLSALATAGIIFYSEFLAPSVEEKIKKISIKCLRRFIFSIFSTFMITLSATAFTLPVSLTLYNRFNFMVFAANIVAVPISGLCMILCAIGSAIGNISLSIINIFAYFGGKICQFMIGFSERLSEIKIFSFNIEDDETAVIIISLFLICIFSLILAYYGKSYPKLTAVLCGFVFTVLLVMFSLADKSLTEIRVVDCGNGTAVLISKNEETVLFGTGGNDFLSAYNLSHSIDNSGDSLQALITPEIDRNSSTASVKILETFSPDEIYCNNISPEITPLVKNYSVNTFESEISFCSFDVSCFSLDKKSFAFIDNEDVSVLLMFDPISDFSNIPDKYTNADVIIMRNDYPDGIENSDASFVVVNADNARGVIVQDELNKLGLKTVATAGCGDVIIKADDGDISAYRDD